MAASQENIETIEPTHPLKTIPQCEEYEKMVAGKPYRSWESAILENAQVRAKRLCDELNSTHYLKDGVEWAADVVHETRMRILKSLLRNIQGTPRIETQFSVLYGCNTSIGRNFYANWGLAIDDSGFVTIGDDVIIGPQVSFITINHPTDVAERLHGGIYTRPITIGSACWIGAKVMILPGATVGYGCTIGAGAVVSGEIPEYSVAVGVPARVVKRVFPKDSELMGVEKVDGVDSRDLHDGEKDRKNNA